MNSWKWMWLPIVVALAGCGQPTGNVEPQKVASGQGKEAASEVRDDYKDAELGPGAPIYTRVLQAKDPTEVGAHIEHMQCLHLTGPMPFTGNYRVTPVHCPGMTTPHEWKAQVYDAAPVSSHYVLEPVVGGPKHSPDTTHVAFMQILETDGDGAPKKIKVWMQDHEAAKTKGHHAGSAHLRY